MRIKIFYMSPLLLDGGSIENINTNLGIFSLKKYPRDKENYFTIDGQEVIDIELKESVFKAIKQYNDKDNSNFKSILKRVIKNNNKINEK